jgi:hypothetical protein
MRQKSRATWGEQLFLKKIKSHDAERHMLFLGENKKM